MDLEKKKNFKLKTLGLLLGESEAHWLTAHPKSVAAPTPSIHCYKQIT